MDDGGRGGPGASVETKTAAGKRTVPVVPQLRSGSWRTSWHREGWRALVFGRAASDAFVPSTVRRRALEAWGWRQVPNAERGDPQTVWIKARNVLLEPIALHECRHTTASLLIAAGVNIKTVSAVMGHASVTITLDRYGHLLPGSVAEAGELLAARLERA